MKSILKSKSFWGAIIGALLMVFDAIPYDWAPWVLSLVAVLRILSNEIREGKAILDAVKKAGAGVASRLSLIAVLVASGLLIGCPHADWAGAGCELEKNDAGEYEYVCSGKVLVPEFEGQAPGGQLYFTIDGKKRLPIKIKASDMGVPKCR